MYAVIFKAKMNKVNQEYLDTAEKMRELAGLYGCVEFISVTEGEQEITISYWENPEQIKKWKQNPEHLDAQERGKSIWYKSYQVQVVEIYREYSSEKN